MLSITPSGSSSAAKDYFSNSLSKGDYYVKDGSNQVEIVGQWHGHLAKQLGLEGDITQDQFNALADNANPETGEKLTARNVQNRIAGYDFTFNAPKSLSVLYEMTEDDRLLDAFRDSVTKTMSHIEEDMETRVRKDGLNENRTTSNMVWGEFIHTTSRPVDGKPDPHLHIHAYAFNATYDEEEEKMKAGKFRNIKRDGNYYEAYFHSELSNTLSDMGLDIERKGRFWEIADLERETIEKFSNRTLQVEQTANEYGITNNDTKAKLARFNREQKNEDATKDDLRHEWESRLTEEEKNTINGAFDSDNNQDSITLDQAKQHAIEHVFERSSVVSERKLKEQALRYSFGDLTPDNIENAFDSEELIKREIEGKTHVTTKTVLNEEKEIVDYVKNGFNTESRLNPDYNLQPQVNKATGEMWHFEGEAKAAIEHILESRDSVIALQGYAGTGKTTLMNEAVNGINQNGKDVFTFAPSSDATDVLKEEGFDNSYTVARLLLDEKLQNNVENQVIWIDEAGLLSTPQMKKVFDIAEEQNARVILGGDVGQHNSVERGDAFRILQTEAGMEPATISDIRRQKPQDYREAVLKLAEGKTQEGFEILDKRGAIQEINTDERYLNLAREYVQAINDGKTALVVSPTHAEGNLVTNEIRQIMKEQGAIAENDHEYNAYKNLSWTQSQRQDAFQYEEGLIIRYVQNASGKTKGDSFTVTGHDDENNILIQDKAGNQSQLNLEEANRFNIYQSQILDFAQGDVIRVTENSLTKNGKNKLNNGALYEIDGFTSNGDIRTKEGYIIDAERGNLSHGFVTTSHASQGKTVDSVFIAQSSDSFGASSIEQFYVSASRGREEIKIFTDDKENLLEAVQESGQRLSSMEFVKDESPEERNKKYFAYQEIIDNARQWGKSAAEQYYKLGDLVKDGIEKTLDRYSPPTLENMTIKEYEIINEKEKGWDK